MRELTPDILRYVPDDGPPAGLREAEQQALELIQRKVGARESLDAIVHFLAEATREISPCDRVSLALLEEDGRRLVSVSTWAAYEPLRLRSGYAEDLSGSSLAAVCERGVLRIIDDLPAYLECRPESRATRLLVEEGVRSSLTSPLRVEGRVVGVLFRSCRRPRAYDERQAWLHQAVAERLAQVVERAWRVQQLTEANRAYFELLGFVAHELKSPLASILTEVNLLLDGYVGELTGPQQERLRRIVRRGHYLLNLTGDYLNLARLEGGQVRVEPRRDVDFVREVLAPAVELLAPQFESRRMELVQSVPPELPAVACDPRLVKIIVVNLLSNAVKYGNVESEVRLTVTRPPGRLLLTVWNEGEGWPDVEQHRLFRRFSRLRTPRSQEQKGSGVGLYTAWRLAQLHGGHLRARSEYGHWAEFTLELPQPG